MPKYKDMIFDDNETSEDILLDLPPEEIDRLYEKVFGKEDN